MLNYEYINFYFSISRQKKSWYTFEWEKGRGERKVAGIFTYTSPGNQLEKDFNWQALLLLETKRAHLLLESLSIGSHCCPIRESLFDKKPSSTK